MKTIQLIVGILLILFGCGISFGTVIGLLEGTSEYSITTDIIGLVMIGIGPIVGGLFLCRQALYQYGDGRPTGSEVANREPEQE